jgi:hypothetical protein
MNKIANASDLKAAILNLEKERTLQEIELRKQFFVTYDSLKPTNIISNTIQEIISSSKIKTGIADITAGMAAGYIAKKAVVGSSPGFFKELMGSAVQMLVANEVTKNADGLLAFGKKMLLKVLKPKN